MPAGAALKLEANKIAEIDIRASADAICSAEAPVELFFCFFMERGWMVEQRLKLGSSSPAFRLEP